MYQALYRKYRPIDFDSVVGQKVIVKTLKNSIINNSFSHAYMFFGPRGTGKTTISKIFARNINCLNPIDGNSCKKCSSCKVSFSRECVDIIEIDAASNNGVDEIRELRNNVNLVPSSLKYKVYIIDEVHMLSIGAFNALLKTLEEPPEHVVFILATTDPQKVPETIVSRCQCFSFESVSQNDIILKLNEICDLEKIDIETGVIDKIALSSNGGLRDALGLLDKIVSYSDKKITMKDFEIINGIVSDDDINQLIKCIFDGNISSFLNKINEYSNCGKNIIQIIIQIIYCSRNMLVDYYLNGTELFFSIDLLHKFIDKLNSNINNMKKSFDPKMYIEMLILKFINDNILINKSLNSDVNTNDSNDVKIFDIKDDSNDSIPNNYSTNVLNIRKKIININDIISVRINNTMATAEKNLLELEKKKFDLLYDYSFDQEIGSFVNNLLDSKLRACGNNSIIISYPSSAIVDQNIDNIVTLNDIYNNITKSNKKIAIVSDKKWTEIKDNYIKMIKSGKKYKIQDEPEILFEEIDNDDIISSSAVDLFGDDIVEIVKE